MTDGRGAEWSHRQTTERRNDVRPHHEFKLVFSFFLSIPAVIRKNLVVVLTLSAALLLRSPHTLTLTGRLRSRTLLIQRLDDLMICGKNAQKPPLLLPLPRPHPTPATLMRHFLLQSLRCPRTIVAYQVRMSHWLHPGKLCTLCV